jgi:hypothetical protein
MTRFAWLQSRSQTFVATVGLAILVVVYFVTGHGLLHLYHTIITPCLANDACSPTSIDAFLRYDEALQRWLDILVVVVPGILGVFWGAPLFAREIETGTHRLAWTQSVTRSRWLSVKVGMGLAISMAVAALLSLMVTRWSSPVDLLTKNVFGSFERRDIVPIGYSAFGFALGVAAGVFIRRTLPAMASVAVAYTAARLAMAHWIRPRLIAPAHLVLALDPGSTGFGRTNSGPASLQPSAPRLPNAWINSTQIVDKAGHGLTSQFLASACPDLGTVGPPSGGPGVRTQVSDTARTALVNCVTKVGETYHVVVTYQPASRYWAFQWYETAIFLGAALVLAGVCIWSVRRRRT